MNRTVLKGARTHNLREVSLELEPGELVAVVGVSGSGKSSLCLDTLYAEGQRRFVESFSPYARQFLERHQRPPIDSLDPVPAAVAVDRRAPVKSSRSTVASMADIEPYLSALFFREAMPLCPHCKQLATWTDSHRLAASLCEQFSGQCVLVLAPSPVHGTASYLEARERLLAQGLRRLWLLDGLRDIDTVKPSEVLAASAYVEPVMDRLKLDGSSVGRLQEAIEQAWMHAEGLAVMVNLDGPFHAVQADACDCSAGVTSAGSREGHRLTLRKGLVCPSCATAFAPAKAGLFSYQSPLGACANCHGFGRVIGVDLHKVFPDPSKSLAKGAIRPWNGKSATWERSALRKYCDAHRIDMNVPWSRLTPRQQEMVIVGERSWGKNKYPGVLLWFEYLESKAYKMHVRVLLARYRSYDTCPVCDGKRLNPASLCYQVDGLDLAQWHRLELVEARKRLEGFMPRDPQGKLIRGELLSRIVFLCHVGLGYLTLDRQSRTLSGGEAQRVSLTAALGASLSGALIVVDEPTVGLHPSDIPPLVDSMRSLANQGNCVVVVEHDPSVIMATDRVIELGPGAGANGGKLLFNGTPTQLVQQPDSPTGKALAALADRSACSTHDPQSCQTTFQTAFRVVGARENNLKNVTVDIPLHAVCALSGPSGSGKSTLAERIIYRGLARKFGDFDIDGPGAHDAIEGIENVDGVDSLCGVLLVDQSPIGRTSRGNAATYTKAWDRIRQRFAASPMAREAGLSASHFSFNVAAGRCKACAGEGAETVEMQFLADVSFECPVCRGKRFNEEVLRVSVDGKSVADVLTMTVDEVLDWLDDDAAIRRALTPLQRLGLGYLALGQPLSTLSGGEAQRLKIARAMRSRVGNHLVVLDEPSAGLHPQDVQCLIRTMHDLVRQGASVLVVDHDLDVLRAADWIIDLGPGAGSQGGTVVDQGTPEHIAQGNHRTAKALRGEYLPSVGAKPPRTATGQQAPSLRIHNARENNLKDVCCTIPTDSLVVVTGPSGSGKSSLVFDVLFAEGQRRFLETLTPYARKFLPTLPRPDVDSVQGMPPAIALEQRRSRTGANSTVATVTEVAHYLRLIYSKVGVPYCPKCDIPVAVLTLDGLCDKIRSTKGSGSVYAPAVQNRKGLYHDLLVAAHRAGIETARVDGQIVSTGELVPLRKTKEHTIDLLLWQGRFAQVPTEAVRTAAAWGKGSVRVAPHRGQEFMVSSARACPRCSMGIPEMDPRWFSFNTQQGRCERCEGTGLEQPGSDTPCRECQGARLAKIPRSVRVHDMRYADVTAQSVADAMAMMKRWKFRGTDERLAGPALQELVRRLRFLQDVGLGYLGLHRDASTLSGGEMQRLRLSAQLGAGLTGALYVLDEPTIGLHPSDTSRLLQNLHALVDTGSTVVVVEHDVDTIRSAHHVIDMGPGGGHHGGTIVAEGPSAKVLACETSPTARALAHRTVEQAPGVDGSHPRSERLERAQSWLRVTGATAHNLKNIDVALPLGCLTVVAGVSGSGKSTLVQRILLPRVREKLGLEAEQALAHKDVFVPKATETGPSIERAVAVDQQPIGRTPRSVPATFLGIWDDLRKLFASLPEAQVRGFTATRFSFNSASGGRCPACHGMGTTSHEMSFLPDVITPCDACGGGRFEPGTREVMYRGLSIADVLRLTVAEASKVFAVHKKIATPLRTLEELGLGYIQLGQGSHTLSGGEAQRLKLAQELSPSLHHRPTLYVLDEPTTGLHVSDVAKLVRFLHALVARGDTLVVIEHHPDVIASADYVIELGPEGGHNGGHLVAACSPRELSRQRPLTSTGRVLKELFAQVDRRETVANRAAYEGTFADAMS